MGDFSNGEQLRRLPLRALVAFASRCARRIQPQYVLENDHPTKQTSTNSINAAIRVAEEFAMGGSVDAKKAATATRDAEEAYAAAQDPEFASPEAVHAAKAALAAVGAANICFAVKASQGMDKEVWVAVEIAGESMIAAMADEETASRALAFDLETLAELELGEFPEWGETVDPMEDGPLGPLVPPKHRLKQKKAPASKAKPESDKAAAPNRAMQALERIDALRMEIEEDDPEAAAKKRLMGQPRQSSKAAATGAVDHKEVAQLQQRLQKELERVLAAKTALDEERIQLQTERESFESRLKKTSSNRGEGGIDTDLRQLAKERRQIHAERQVLEDDQAAFTEELEQFEIDRAKFQQEERRLQREREKLEPQREETRKERARLEKHRNWLRLKLQEFREHRSHVTSPDMDGSALWQQLQPVQQELQEIDEEQATLKSELQDLQQSIADVAQGERSVGMSAEAVESLRQDNAQLQAEIEKLRTELTRAADETDSRLEAERQKLQQTQAELEQRALTFQENEAALKEALVRITEEQGRFAMQQSELEKLKAELESRQQAFQTEQSRFQDLIDVTFRR
ncbi:hypothetical protein Mal52_52540 [Symmachiella dynata]|uniref:Uncharacterized protein n=1 Tax=Symmachiella dynata TaxID=2527995 RepID=A0A517ZW62_9PLAN|nr:hypothetical protein [Symmachiella dynata]QDU46732.1 hypothetical protein Mal52_52540 [Symmachiella dynata]